jgi:hypothetical protein
LKKKEVEKMNGISTTTGTNTTSKAENIESPLSKSLLHQIISVLEEILTFTEPSNNENAQEQSFSRKSSFDAVNTPNITPRDYLLRIDQILKFSDEIYVACLIYIDKLVEATSLTLNPRNIHK